MSLTIELLVAYSGGMVTSERIEQARQQFLADVERLAEVGVNNAVIGRALGIHRNAVFYWRNGTQRPDRFVMEAVRSKLDALLEENNLTPTPERPDPK